MSTFEQAGREIDSEIADAKQRGRRVARNVRVAGDIASDEIRTLLDELDDSLRHDKETDVEALRARVGDQVARARALLEDAQDTVRDHVQSAVAATEDRIHERPWETLGAVAAIAFLLGVIAGRG